MTEFPIIDPELDDKSCWLLTCDKQAVGHDTSVIHRTIIKVPLCSYHLAHPVKGKVGMLTKGEVHWFLKFERLIRWFGKRKGNQ